MKLRLKGKEAYAYHDEIIDVVVDTNQNLSIVHEGNLVEVTYGESGKVIFEKQGFGCEVE